MKTNIIRKVTLCGCVAMGLGFASCEDFLTITPTNSIVEEEFWEDKKDLENVVASCYKQLVGNDVLTKYIQWGEMRSDNFEKTTGVNNTDMQNLMNANLLPTNGMFGWDAFYRAINYCNKVLVHGPEILTKDESFSNGDWEPIRAEVIALRAYSHFWLVRTFGEIPYVTEDYNNDEQDMKLPQSTQLQVLDNIISDLESVKDVAMKDYNDNVYNKGRITRKAVYALLADVYLWRASYKAGNNKPFEIEGVVRPEEVYATTAADDYRRCIECCDEVISMMKEEKMKSLTAGGGYIGDDVELTLDDLLIPNDQKAASDYATDIDAYNNIFGASKNSSESIFELQVEGTSYTNTMVGGTKDGGALFWNIEKGTQGNLNCSSNLFASSDESPNTTLPTCVFTKSDLRKWETIRFEKIGQVNLSVAKYVMRLVTQNSTAGAIYDNTSESLDDSGPSYSMRTKNCDANWIVYRLSDIMLMKAEAITQIHEDEENLTEAFNLCRSIFKRSNPDVYVGKGSKDSLDITMFQTKDALESLVMAERQREFVAEGKRWFDLVRYAQRKGGTQEMLVMLTRKFASENKKAIEAKLSTIQSLFSPIYESELKTNGLLHQNEVWATDESTSKTDDL